MRCRLSLRGLVSKHQAPWNGSPSRRCRSAFDEECSQKSFFPTNGAPYWAAKQLNRREERISRPPTASGFAVRRRRARASRSRGRSLGADFHAHKKTKTKRKKTGRRNKKWTEYVRALGRRSIRAGITRRKNPRPDDEEDSSRPKSAPGLFVMRTFLAVVAAPAQPAPVGAARAVVRTARAVLVVVLQEKKERR